MKNLKQIILATLMLSLAIVACNLPGQKATPTQLEPTPNQTMTALFNIVTQQPTIAPPISTATESQPQVVTATTAPSTSEPTIAPTNTSRPLTATKTSTSVPRPGSKTDAAYLATAPTLDGVWDEWNTTAYPAKFVVFGKSNWTGKDDLEGSYRIGWDNTYLYLAVKVIDDKYVQNASGIDLYKGDSIEVLLDTGFLGDFSSPTLDGDDYQLVVSPGKPDTKGIKEAYLYYPSNVAGSRPQVKIGSVGGDGLYRIEFAMPWSMFGVTPSTGMQFGFAVSINDNDNPSVNEQQTLVSNDPDRVLTDPTTWTLLTLTH
jgi:hypothetical protein